MFVLPTFNLGVLGASLSSASSGFSVDSDTEANILARTGDSTGVILYGTDTGDLYVYDGMNWQTFNNT